MNTPVYLNNWKDQTDNSFLLSEFDIQKEELEGVNILLASYTYEDYSGNAFVLFEKEGVLYEVNGSHCSCYGLEDQWEPEEAVIEELRNRINKGNLGFSIDDDVDEFSKELTAILDEIEPRQKPILRIVK